jgi:hypothetical protein
MSGVLNLNLISYYNQNLNSTEMDIATQPKKKKEAPPAQSQVSRKIMMRKYGLDEGRTYQETNTLLEPNNFIPSWEAGDEEKKEVSSALRKLREKYDQIFRLAESKRKEFEQLNVSGFSDKPKYNTDLYLERRRKSKGGREESLEGHRWG